MGVASESYSTRCVYSLIAGALLGGFLIGCQSESDGIQDPAEKEEIQEQHRQQFERELKEG